MIMYRIFADYRPKDSIAKHWYYVLAKNKAEAKRRFSDRVGWLKIYEIEKCNQDTYREVVSNPYKYILIS